MYPTQKKNSSNLVRSLEDTQRLPPEIVHHTAASPLTQKHLTKTPERQGENTYCSTLRVTRCWATWGVPNPKSDSVDRQRQFLFKRPRKTKWCPKPSCSTQTLRHGWEDGWEDGWEQGVVSLLYAHK